MGTHGQVLRLKTRHELQQALNALPVPAFVFAVHDGRFLDANKPFEELLGYNAAELLAMAVEEIQPHEHVNGCHEARTQAPPQGLLRWQYRRKDGGLLNVRVHYRDVSYVNPAEPSVLARFVVVEFWDAQAA